MKISTEYGETQASQATLVDAIRSAYREAEMLHPEKIGGGDRLHVLFTFCPLYDRSSLQESGLIFAPAQIGDSRVSVKWEADKKVVAAIADYLAESGKKVSLTVVLADKGVLLNHEPTQADEDALSYHASLYQDAVTTFCEEKGIEVEFMRFQDENLEIKFPTFVNPNAAIPFVTRPEGFKRRGTTNPADPETMAMLLKEYMQSLGIESIPAINKKVRETLKELIKAFGPETTFWMVAGYLAFDYKIPELLGDGGVYISTERFSPIFRIARLTPSLNDMARVEVKA